MDKFEASLLKTSASSESDVGSKCGQKPRAARMSDSKSNRDRAGEGESFTEGEMGGGDRYTNVRIIGPMYRSVVRGLSAAGEGGGEGRERLEGSGGSVDKGGGRPSMSCLSLSARKPLLAGITRVPGDYAAKSDGALGVTGDVEDGDVSARVGSVAEESSMPPRNPASAMACAGIGSTRAVKLQVWNYRTKRLLVSHRFEQGGASSTNDTGDDDDGGTGGGKGGPTEAAGNKDGGSDAGAEEDGGGNDAAPLPVALSLHPSGDSIAVAFPHYISVYYIVGGGCVQPRKEGVSGGGGGGLP